MEEERETSKNKDQEIVEGMKNNMLSETKKKSKSETKVDQQITMYRKDYAKSTFRGRPTSTTKIQATYQKRRIRQRQISTTNHREKRAPKCNKFVCA